MGFGAILNQNKISTGGTTYTNEQILNPSDATLIGLTGNPIPADMFHTLATAGDLYVWRRTVSSLDGKPEVPAGYTLGEIETNVFISTATGSGNVGIQFSDTVTVSNNGVVSLSSPLSIGTSASNWTYSSKYDSLKGKYCKVTTTNATSEGGDVFFFPSDGMLRTDTNGLYATEYQKVVGTPYQPAVPPGTVTVDYPVSVNPNAYQTGSDAQPAGYTLGAVQSGNKTIGNSSTDRRIYYSDAVSVSDDGKVSLVNQKEFVISVVKPENGSEVLRNKFVRSVSLQSTGIIYIPQSANFSSGVSVTGVGKDLYTSQYQTVTGYPAIPAGTTIEALGKLGDKARVEVGSYVGTGTSIASIPIKKSAKMVIVTDESGYKLIAIKPAKKGTGYWSNTSSAFCTLSWSDSGLSIDGNQPNYAMNSSGSTYYYCVFY